MSSSGREHSTTGGNLSEAEALRRMYRITGDHDRPMEEKIRGLLVLGRTYLDVRTGFLTKVSDGTQLIVEASGDHDLLQPGESCPLSKSYCRKTVTQESLLSVQHAAVEGWEGDAAYEKFGLESYIGSKVIVDGEVYGTFCFADSEPRDLPFTDVEEAFVELMAMWVSYDRFQTQATDQIRQQRDQLERFAETVSHDLRNPLSIVQGYLDLAEETGDSVHFDRCRNALRRMEVLIDDLLLLAREGETIAETESIDLSSLVCECWSFVATEEATLEVQADRVITGDWNRLQQLFENLFRNAIEHGGSDVTVRVGTLNDDSGVYIEDDGPGIPEADREAVFEDGYSTATEGIGLGLTIVNKISEAHGWRVGITESTSGGARFELSNIEFVD